MNSVRVSNLDLVRAAAIVMVLFFHTVEWLPVHPAFIDFLVEPGKFGVDLFFVLSGLLVGRLFLNEHLANGCVDTRRFILRRVTRTFPLYLLILIPVLLGSCLLKKESFHWEYFLFLQNYILEIPYFKISWSLCVEEHFYLVLPFALALIIVLKRQYRTLSTALFLLIMAIPLLFRFVSYSYSAPFGYFETASHFRYDSIAFGVVIAWITIHNNVFIEKLHYFRPQIFFLCVVVLYLTNILSPRLVFVFGLPAISLSFALLIGSLYYGNQLKISKHKAIGIIASEVVWLFWTGPIVNL
jgi:peptidoglycan/LPS O-acetylase OafA/YrhL